MRISRNATGTVFLVGALILTLAALAYPVMTGAQNTATSSSRIIANTRYGPLTEADRDFVVKVRSAGLWEFRLGRDAVKRGTTAAMREAGEHLVVGHALLDASCRRIAQELNITLPNQATPQQQQFVATVEGNTGKQFDTTAVNIMRVTHGQIFPVIAKIRATTKNTLVRQLANEANDVVLDHIASMEKTGLVNFDQVLFQETTPPKLPKDQLTPPVPQPGAPVVVLTAPPGLKNPYTNSFPSTSPTTG
jgi:predicted outer membrane protein